MERFPPAAQKPAEREAAARCARSRGGGGRPPVRVHSVWSGGAPARPRTRAAAAARSRAPRPAEEGESRSALPNATSPGVLWHRARRESARELPSRRGLFLTCPPFSSCLSGLRARQPARSTGRGRAGSSPRAAAPASARRLPPARGPRPCAGISRLNLLPGKDRLGAACLSAKYWNRVGWGRGARRSRPLASLPLPPCAQSGCGKIPALSARESRGNGGGVYGGGEKRRATPSNIKSLPFPSQTPTLLQLGSFYWHRRSWGSGGVAKRGAAYPHAQPPCPSSPSPSHFKHHTAASDSPC